MKGSKKVQGVMCPGGRGKACASPEAEACFQPSGNCKASVAGGEQTTVPCKATVPVGCCKGFGLSLE